MDAYGEYRYQIGFEQGLKEGREIAIVERIIHIIQGKFPDWSFEFIMDILEVPHDKRELYLKYIDQ